jgi:signal transduction histidine kinase
MAQEAVANVLKHAHATALEVTLRRQDDAIILTVKDNGHGFDPSSAPAANGRPHYGQQDMRERAQLLGALLTVTSETGGGARIEVVLPRAT